MKIRIWMGTVFAALVLLGSSVAFAGPGVAFSLGEGFTVGEGDTQRTDFNLEALVYYGIGIIRADLGLLFNVENPDSDIILRPGARVYVPGILYGRVAFPVAMSGDGNWGFMMGIGKNLLNLAALKLFVEVDATFWEQVNFSDVVPLEARVGLEIGF